MAVVAGVDRVEIGDLTVFPEDGRVVGGAHPRQPDDLPGR
jgi:hypothetical protein